MFNNLNCLFALFHNKEVTTQNCVESICKILKHFLNNPESICQKLNIHEKHRELLSSTHLLQEGNFFIEVFPLCHRVLNDKKKTLHSIFKFDKISTSTCPCLKYQLNQKE